MIWTSPIKRGKNIILEDRSEGGKSKVETATDASKAATCIWTNVTAFNRCLNFAIYNLLANVILCRKSYNIFVITVEQEDREYYIYGI